MAVLPTDFYHFIASEIYLASESFYHAVDRLATLAHEAFIDDMRDRCENELLDDKLIDPDWYYNAMENHEIAAFIIRWMPDSHKDSNVSLWLRLTLLRKGPDSESSSSSTTVPSSPDTQADVVVSSSSSTTVPSGPDSSPSLDGPHAVWRFISEFAGPFYHPEWPEHCYWHSGCGPVSPGLAVCEEDLLRPAFHAVRDDGSPGWLRIPIAAWTPAPKLPDRSSHYGGLDVHGLVRGFHRCSAEAILGCPDRQDWLTGRLCKYPGIGREGRMRNGFNDSNSRGVWFYLHFLMPWHPGNNEVVVELLASRSTGHSGKKKWHAKHCACADAGDGAPGELSEYTQVVALHLPSAMVPV